MSSDIKEVLPHSGYEFISIIGNHIIAVNVLSNLRHSQFNSAYAMMERIENEEVPTL